MSKRHPLALLDLLLFIATISGLALVPSTVIPQASWAAAFGSYHLAVYAFQLMRNRRFQSAEVGRLLAGVVFLAMAAASAIGVTKPLALLAVISGVFLITGLAWAAVNASAADSQPPKE